MNTTTNTANLTQADLGKNITITGPDWSITGTLWRVSHETDRISIQHLTSVDPEEIPGRRSVQLRVGPFDFTATGIEAVRDAYA